MPSRIISFRDLIVWQKSLDLVIACYAVTRRFPASERFALTDQTQRAAVSIPGNIAEGHGKAGPGHFALHVSHSLGSLRELETMLEIARRLGYMPEATFVDLAARMDEIGRMLQSLRSKLEAKRARPHHREEHPKSCPLPSCPQRARGPGRLRRSLPPTPQIPHPAVDTTPHLT